MDGQNPAPKKPWNLKDSPVFANGMVSTMVFQAVRSGFRLGPPEDRIRVPTFFLESNFVGQPSQPKTKRVSKGTNCWGTQSQPATVCLASDSPTRCQVTPSNSPCHPRRCPPSPRASFFVSPPDRNARRAPRENATKDRGPRQKKRSGISWVPSPPFFTCCFLAFTCYFLGGRPPPRIAALPFWKNLLGH